MDIKELLSHVDHTLLSVDCTWDMIKEICDDGMRFGTASVCIPPCFVKQAAEYCCGKVKICTVIGFPNGYNTTEVKLCEAMDAIANGADELDMVINIGMLKSGNTVAIQNEISAIKEVCGSRVLKVIIEACLLTDDEKRTMCRIVHAAGADYIKTSTGFSKGGATVEDVKLLAENAPKGLKVKAAGGISSAADGAEFIALGADRLGTSRIVKSIKSNGADSDVY